MNDIIKNLLINTSKKSMLESIDGINDIDFLKKELKKHLRNEFNLQQRIDKVIDFINSQSPDAGVSGKYIKKILKGEQE